MTTDTQSATLLEPPAELESLERGRWLARPPTDPVVAYLEAEHWSGTTNLPTWQAARLSHAVYLYRETGTQWAAVAKHCTVKTGRDALRHAEAERERLQQAIAAGLAEGPIRAVRFLSLWRGILFQEYVDGLTLEDLIAIRTTRPGVLESALQRVAQLLVTLHTGGVQPDREPEFSPAVSYTNRLVDELGRWGVLEGNEIVRDGLKTLLGRWERQAAMSRFTPAAVHGDATTSNFVFPSSDEVVAIDWERLWVTDPAFDLGRLMAEISHSITRWGGNESEAQYYAQLLASAYGGALPPGADAGALVSRATFYHASSALRIARNGWVSRLDRMGLVAQAMALLARLDD